MCSGAALMALNTGVDANKQDCLLLNMMQHERLAVVCIAAMAAAPEEAEDAWRA
jgi:hypothetical protein